MPFCPGFHPGMALQTQAEFIYFYIQFVTIINNKYSLTGNSYLWDTLNRELLKYMGHEFLWKKEVHTNYSVFSFG